MSRLGQHDKGKAKRFSCRRQPKRHPILGTAAQTITFLVDWIWLGFLSIPSFGLRAIHVAKRNDRFFAFIGEANKAELFNY